MSPERAGRVVPTHLLGSVDGRLVALELAHVVEVLPMLALEEAPGGPPGLLGFANVGGEPIPVFKVRTLFGLADASDDCDHRIVLCSKEGRTVGLALDDVRSLCHPTNGRSPTAEDRIAALEVVRSVAAIEDSVCVALDPAIAAEWLGRTVDPPRVVGEGDGA